MRGRIIVVPTAVAVLGAAAIASIVVLQQRADDGRRAELSLAVLKTELAKLQDAPPKGIPASGGSPALAAELRAGKARIAATLAELDGRDPPVALGRLQAPLRELYAALDRIDAIAASAPGDDREAERLVGVAGRAQAETAALLDEADRAYGHRAARAATRATVGAGAAIALLLGAFGLLYAKNRRLLETSREEALTDALTGLRNRRALVSDLAAGLARATPERPLVLGLLDLDGFKLYNDTFGHLAGDALLARLGERLRAALEGLGTTYRMGGDEFCVLAAADPPASGEIVRTAAAALAESSETFAIGCSYGSALAPAEASSPQQALRLADRRMYAQKAGSASASRQSSDVLLKVLAERSSSLESHVSSVGQLARLLAERLGLPRSEQDRIQVAAELHDIGKTAIPDSLLNKPGELSSEEWEYMRRHTLIGERIILAAPSLARTAALVRSSHERVDGAGYPDGLSGDEIAIGARIIAVCDAFDAMICDRSYRLAIPVADALAELRRHAGTQFDARIVDAFHELAVGLERGEREQAA